MAIYHFSAKCIGRNQGRSAVGAAAYRSGEKLYNDYDGLTHDYTHRRDIIYSAILLPQNAPGEYADRQALWSAVEESEKNKNAQTAREIEIALPLELNQQQQMILLRSYVNDNFVEAGMCADIAIHAGHKHNQEHEYADEVIKPKNPHAHILLTMRPIDDSGAWGAKSKKEYVLDKRGNRIKLKSGEWKSRKVNTTDWNDTKTLLKWREEWAKAQNQEFKRLGLSCRVDHRSYEEQGLDLEPTVHEGVKVRDMEKRGVKTDIGEKNRKIKAKNNESEVSRENVNDLESRYIPIISEAAELGDTERHYLNQKYIDLTTAHRELAAYGVKRERLDREHHAAPWLTDKYRLQVEIGNIDCSVREIEERLKKNYDVAPDKIQDEIKRAQGALQTAYGQEAGQRFNYDKIITAEMQRGGKEQGEAPTTTIDKQLPNMEELPFVQSATEAAVTSPPITPEQTQGDMQNKSEQTRTQAEINRELSQLNEQIRIERGESENLNRRLNGLKTEEHPAVRELITKNLSRDYGITPEQAPEVLQMYHDNEQHAQEQIAELEQELQKAAEIEQQQRQAETQNKQILYEYAPAEKEKEKEMDRGYSW